MAAVIPSSSNTPIYPAQSPTPELSKIITQFENTIQGILETSYLQPFVEEGLGPIPPKANPRDGIIERETHGAMHAVRVSIFIQIFHQINLKYRKQKTEAAMKCLEKYFGSIPLLEIFNRLAGIFHDIAREGEAGDQWELQSGNKLMNFLDKNLGQNIFLTIIYKFAVQHKDHPELFKEALESTHRPADLIEASDYIRELLHEADCIEVMRCVGNYQIDRLDTLAWAKENQQKELIEVIIALAQNAHTLLYTQGDLLFERNRSARSFIFSYSNAKSSPGNCTSPRSIRNWHYFGFYV